MDLRALLSAGRIELVPGSRTAVVSASGQGLELIGHDGRRLHVDLAINATGFRPDHTITRELRLALDPALESAAALAPLIDPNVHTCGSVPPHGARQLAHPDPGYYTVGMKSYGRAPTFLLATGYEQVRSVVAALVGGQAGADDVQLTLPAGGVCAAHATLPGGWPVAGPDRCCGGTPVLPTAAQRPATPVGSSVWPLLATRIHINDT